MNGLSGSLGYAGNVLRLNPTVMEIEAPDTRSLLNRAQAGDCEAFGEACRIYETPLLRHALTLCGNATLAEDLAQDTLVEAWKSLPHYNWRCQFFTWLCAILLNRYRNTFRKKRPLPFSTLTGNDQDECQNNLDNLADQELLPDQTAQLREQAALVMHCIEALPPIHQQVIYLRFYVDDSLEGIAAALGCSLGTVKSRLSRALVKLRSMDNLSALPANHERKVGRL